MAAAAPVFYTIGSAHYPGFKLTQRGSQVVLEAEDIDNPFQLWYKDDSWRFVEDDAGNPAFALINNGSRAALKADTDAATPSHVSLFTDYQHSKDSNRTAAWTLRGSGDLLFSVALKTPLRLGIGSSPPQSGDGVVAILGSSSTSSNITTAFRWTLDPFAPKAFILQSQWVSQILIAKEPHTDLSVNVSVGSFNNELGVVAVHQNNQDGNQEVWYKVPAGSPLEPSNSSFIVISRMNGKALKGSTKPGDKVILTEFDPLDNNFVWSEDRSLSAAQDFLAINLANSESMLHWYLPLDTEYQNAAYKHPLTLRQATTTLNRSQWSFVSVDS